MIYSYIENKSFDKYKYVRVGFVVFFFSLFFLLNIYSTNAGTFTSTKDYTEGDCSQAGCPQVLTNQAILEVSVPDTVSPGETFQVDARVGCRGYNFFDALGSFYGSLLQLDLGGRLLSPSENFLGGGTVSCSQPITQWLTLTSLTHTAPATAGPFSRGFQLTGGWPDATFNGNEELIIDGTFTVTVLGGALSPANVLAFVANPATVILGDNTNLSWTATGNISSCGVRDETNSVDFLGYGANDNFDTAPSPIGDVDYTLTCYSSDGNDTDVETVTVTASSLPQCADGSDNDLDGLIDFPNDPGCVDASDDDETDIAPPLPSLDIVYDNIINSGASANVSWDAQNVASCDFTTGAGLTTGFGNSISGSDSTSLLTEDETFIIECTGPNGDISRTRTIGVLPGIGAFVVPDYVISGDTALFEWDPVLGTNVTCVGVNVVPVSDGVAPGQWSLGNKDVLGGTQNVGPITVGGTYQLSCSNVHGTPAPRNQIITVLDPSASISALPQQVLSGRGAVLIWEAQGVDGACSLSRQREGEAGVYDIPDTNYTYTNGSSYNATVLSDNNSYMTLPIRNTTTYTISCPTVSGDVVSSVLIEPFTTEFEER